MATVTDRQATNSIYAINAFVAPEFMLHVNMLAGSTVHCGAQCSAMHYNAVQWSTAQCSTVQCSVKQCEEVQHSTVYTCRTVHSRVNREKNAS